MQETVVLRIIVGILLVTGLFFLILALMNEHASTYLMMSLGAIAAGNFLNLFMMNREKMKEDI